MLLIKINTFDFCLKNAKFIIKILTDFSNNPGHGRTSGDSSWPKKERFVHQHHISKIVTFILF
jgi:hypothetical protein